MKTSFMIYDDVKFLVAFLALAESQGMDVDWCMKYTVDFWRYKEVEGKIDERD